MVVLTNDGVYGARGARLRVACSVEQARQLGAYLPKLIPGALVRGRALEVPFDAYPLLANLLASMSIALPEQPLGPPLVVPGLAEYTEKFVRRLRAHQPEMIRHLVLRSMAVNADPMRAGKTVETLGAAVAIGARKVLIVGPAIARLVWADEIAAWVGEEALLLDGRAAEKARWYCLACKASGRTSEGKWCPACKNKAGTSHGFRAVADVRAAIEQARWVILNYELLVPQGKLDASGKRSLRDDLAGWAPLLSTVAWDVVIPDEAHMLRGRPDPRRRGQTRRDTFLLAAQQAKRCWAVTGTPLYGRTADLWGLLDAVTNGLFGRPQYAFDERYAGGHRDQYGWRATGQTNPEELRVRLKHYMLKRERSVILAGMPPKARQLIRIDKDVKHTDGKGARVATKRATGANALRATVTTKIPDVVDNVTAEMAEGARVIVYAYLKDNARDIATAIEAAIERGDLSAALKSRLARIWRVDGETPTEARVAMARAFREWTGAGVFVATIDSVTVAISLKGATSVHFADLHHDPSAMLQAEDRPYEVGTTGLTVLYYVVAGSFDEHVLNTLLLPKMRQVEGVVGDEGATQFTKLVKGDVDPEAALEACWEQLARAADKAAA